VTAVKHIDDLRGVGKLAVEATKAVTDLVEAMQGAIGGPPARLFSAPVYATIRGITSVVGGILDSALAQLAPFLGEGTASPERGAVLAALNGVLGDYLAETRNPLAIEMRLARPEGAPAKSKIAVFVHGSAMSRRVWQARRDLGYTPVYLDYNSGLHVSTNGRAFDALLETLVAEWPVPVDEIAIVAHSMAGCSRAARVTTRRRRSIGGATSSGRSSSSGRRTMARRSSAPATGSRLFSA